MPILQELMLFLKSKGNDDFIESVVAYFGAPVTAGLKCACLVNISRCGQNILGDWLNVRTKLSGRLSVDFAEMLVSERSVLLLIYRERELLRVLSMGGVQTFLAQFGYNGDLGSSAPYIARLQERFSRIPRDSQGSQKMPHEVGVFLDYPLEDVKGFIENGGRNAKFAGYWKVYGNEIEAMRRFEAFRRAETRSASLLLRKAQGLTEAA